MAVVTVFVIAPFSFFVAIIWTFVIIKKIRSIVVPVKHFHIILLEFFKIIILIILTVLFFYVGMILVGIIGFPILFIFLVIGLYLIFKYINNISINIDKNFLFNIIYNIILIAIILFISVYVIFYVVLGKQEITQNNYEISNSNYKIEDLISINLRMSNNGKPEIIETRKFLFTKHVKKIYPDVFDLQVAYHFESDDIVKIKINKYYLILKDNKKSLYDYDFDLFGSVYYKDTDRDRSSDDELTVDEVQSFKKTKSMLLIRNSNERITSLISNYPDVEIDTKLNDNIIFEYNVDLVMKSGSIRNIHQKNEFHIKK